MLTTLTILSREHGKLYGNATGAEELVPGFDGSMIGPVTAAGARARSWIGRLARWLATSTLGAARVHPFG